ncbi:MAG: nucleotidyltransferase family protein [Candidatus Omnitrophica bacterium]|nr:nucleotidyltransferase family protein [Candidatus Omnitrophota bacterium]MDD5592967.1 nucleotidyltransferase family protein [Candidatus Omnitrophota bacterium]
MILYEEILREFHRQKVKYVLVGGIAVNLLGSLRSTADLDILVEMSDDNLRKVVSILKRKGYHVKQPVDPMGIANEKLRHEWIHNKHMKAFNFYKEDDLKEVDIIIESPVSYEEAKKGALKIKIEDTILPVISIDNLIKMKKNTGRSVDKFDVEELKKIKKIKRIK